MHIDAYNPDYVLSYCDTLARGEIAIREEEELTRETARLLDSICREISDAVESLDVACGDLFADMDESDLL